MIMMTEKLLHVILQPLTALERSYVKDTLRKIPDEVRQIHINICQHGVLFLCKAVAVPLKGLILCRDDVC